MEYASNGKGNLGVALGAIGTGLSLVGGAGTLLGYSAQHPNYATKDDLTMMQLLADKDSKIAMLQAENTSETKMIEVYKQAHAEVAALRDHHEADMKDIRDTINANRREQDLWNANQSVANATISAAIATNNASISAIKDILGEITQIRVPNTAVCPGWGEVKVAPAG